MSTGHWHITPVNGYDISALESWLAKNASYGKKFSFTFTPFTYFEPIEPVQLQIHLEPIRGKVEEDPELSDLFASAGWQYWGTFRSNYHVFATEDLEAQAHTDPELLDYALKRFFKQKAMWGIMLVIINVLLLNFFAADWLDIMEWRFFWAENLAGNFLPWLLTRLGLLLVDLAYLHGLFVLWRLQRRTKKGLPLTPTPGSSLSGKAAALAVIPLSLVALEAAFLFLTHGYFPYDLANSNFVTMVEIEGEDFWPTGDLMYNMDYISHGYTLLTVPNWYFQQWESSRVFGSGGSLDNIPHIEIRITRYPLSFLAERRAWEWQAWGGHDSYQALEPTDGLDEVWISHSERREGFCYLIVREGGTVMRVEYQGTKDITQYLPRFAQMLEEL